MNRQEFILATLSTIPEHKYSPVQVQKLFFLIDKLLHEENGKQYFDFKPYHYGPFDPKIYEELNHLYYSNYVDINKSQYNGYNVYSLTPEGIEKGIKIFEKLSNRSKKGIKKLNEFVTKLDFAELVSVIYENFPEMKQNSIFNT